MYTAEGLAHNGHVRSSGYTFKINLRTSDQVMLDIGLSAIVKLSAKTPLLKHYQSHARPVLATAHSLLV